MGSATGLLPWSGRTERWRSGRGTARRSTRRSCGPRVRVLVTCDSGGGQSDFIALSGNDSEFQRQVAEFCRVIERFDANVITPHIDLRRQGKSDEEAVVGQFELRSGI